MVKVIFQHVGNGSFKPLASQGLIAFLAKECPGAVKDSGYGQRCVRASKKTPLVLVTGKGNEFEMRSSGTLSLQHQAEGSAARTFLEARADRKYRTFTLSFASAHQTGLVDEEIEDASDEI